MPAVRPQGGAHTVLLPDSSTSSPMTGLPRKGFSTMHRLLLVGCALVMTGCGVTPPGSTSTQSSTSSPADTGASPGATASATAEAEADGVFVFVPAVIDCPGGCPESSISEALAEPGTPGTPMLVNGAVLIEADGSAWFCERLSEDSPPSCEGSRLLFENAEDYGPSLEVNGVQELDGVRWLDDVTITGEVAPDSSSS